VVERVPAFDREGYGIGLRGNGLRACEQLGVADRVQEARTPVGSSEVRTPDGDLLESAPLPEVTPRGILLTIL
jgi:2-polyprenyl-6-methoxyphenol hydroxylase-like FAD-dependent oxidoreductase